MITHEISHIFCVSTCWIRQNRPILTILKSRLTFLGFPDKGFSTPFRNTGLNRCGELSNITTKFIKNMEKSVIQVETGLFLWPHRTCPPSGSRTTNDCAT